MCKLHSSRQALSGKHHSWSMTPILCAHDCKIKKIMSPLDILPIRFPPEVFGPAILTCTIWIFSADTITNNYQLLIADTNKISDISTF